MEIAAKIYIVSDSVLTTLSVLTDLMLATTMRKMPHFKHEKSQGTERLTNLLSITLLLNGCTMIDPIVFYTCLHYSIHYTVLYIFLFNSPAILLELTFLYPIGCYYPTIIFPDEIKL